MSGKMNLFGGLALMVGTSCLLAAPVPEKTPVSISPANVERLRPIKELSKNIWRISLGPRRGEIALLPWEQPVEIVEDTGFGSLRIILEQYRPLHFAASKEGRLLAWCENNTRILMQGAGESKPLVLETGNAQPSVAFSPDSKLLATGGYGTKAKLWDTAGHKVRELDAGMEGGLTVVFSPDGKFLAVGNRNDRTRLYEVATGKLMQTLPSPMTHELAFRPDGKVLAAAYVDGTVALWDVASGQKLQSEASGGKEVYTLDWSPRGDLLVTAGLGGNLVVWDADKLIRLKELPAPEWVISVRFTPDGSRLLSAGGASQARVGDHKVTIWGVSKGTDN